MLEIVIAIPFPPVGVLGTMYLIPFNETFVRYQYLNLVNFLENGVWGGPDPQLENECQWKGYQRFYQVTSAGYVLKGLAHPMRCDGKR